jgi:hypothetical protein
VGILARKHAQHAQVLFALRAQADKDVRAPNIYFSI